MRPLSHAPARWLLVLVALALASARASCPNVPYEVALGDFTLEYWPVAAARVGRDVELTFRGRLTNHGSDDEEVLVWVTGGDSPARSVDGALRFPTLGPGESAASLDALRVRMPRRGGFDPDWLTFLGLDRYFGWREVTAPATGRFRVEEIDGVWWFVTPDGHGLYSIGVTGFDPNGDFSPPLGTNPYRDNVLARYGSLAAWAEVAQDRFRSWNYNSVGGWTDPTLFADAIPYATNGAFSGQAPIVPNVPVLFSRPMHDFFDPVFDTNAAAYAAGFQSCADNPFCIGVYGDNEQPWGRSLFQPASYAEAYVGMPAGTPGKVALQEFFEEYYAGDVAAFNAVFGTALTDFDELQNLTTLGDDDPTEAAPRREAKLAFLAHVSERYHRVVHDALRAVSPDMLILGSRFFGAVTNRGVVEAAGPWLDVVSVNDYDFDPAFRQFLYTTVLHGDLLDHLFLDDAFSDLVTVHELTGKPVMITEWFYRLTRPGVPSLPPSLPEVPDEATRVERYASYIETVAAIPSMLGSHWFQYQDQPIEGRFDGENQLIGLVTIEDDPHAELVERMTQVQGALLLRREDLAE